VLVAEETNTEGVYHIATSLMAETDKTTYTCTPVIVLVTASQCLTGVTPTNPVCQRDDILVADAT